MARATAGGMMMMAVLGCGLHSQKSAGGPYVNGRARVVELYPQLGQVVLETEDGTRINAFWQTEQTTARTGMMTESSALAGPTGVYQEATVQAEVFPAKVGESIDFVGVRMGKEIMLGRVAVVR